MALFEVRNVHKRFGHQVVLERINLSFEKDRLSGVMGPNGAGKTTCFNIMTGKFKPDRGSIHFRDQDITGRPAHRIAQGGIARSFQIINLFNDYTVLQNVLVALPEVRRSGFNPTRDVYASRTTIERAVHVLSLVRLEDDRNKGAKDLPYGKRRALEIAVALAAEPQLLFLDEPTQGLGARQAVALGELINSLRDNVTMVVIEHDMHFLFDIADVISVIHWGQVITTGTPDELMQDPWVMRSSLVAREHAKD